MEEVLDKDLDEDFDVDWEVINKKPFQKFQLLKGLLNRLATIQNQFMSCSKVECADEDCPQLIYGKRKSNKLI